MIYLLFVGRSVCVEEFVWEGYNVWVIWGFGDIEFF